MKISYIFQLWQISIFLSNIKEIIINFNYLKYKNIIINIYKFHKINIRIVKLIINFLLNKNKNLHYD